jgi:hypothetical protein
MPKVTFSLAVIQYENAASEEHASAARTAANVARPSHTGSRVAKDTPDMIKGALDL